MVVVCVMPPPVPVIVMGYVPVLVFLVAVSVYLDVPEPGALIEVRAEAAGNAGRHSRCGKRYCRVESAGDRSGHGDISTLPLIRDPELGETEMVKAGVPEP